MSPDTLSRAEQFRIQARSIITQGRYPFRKVTTDSYLLTSEGHIAPDLIFWINRDSCIAGGCVFFCTQEEIPPLLLKQGQACADALALNQFATWSQSEIVIWQADSLEKRFTMKPHSDLDGLTELLDQFKILAVIEAKNNSELTSWHLSNLCLQSVKQGIPNLSAFLRRKNLSDSENATHQARAKLTLCVARMLTALHADTIPTQTKPEQLDATLWKLVHAEHKPTAVFPEPELDKKSSILLHNLLRRLSQIRLFQGNPQRACDMLDQILTSTIPKGCSMLPPSFELPQAQVSIFTPEVEPGSLNIEIDTGARLLLKNLSRSMHNIGTGATTQYEQVFSVPAPLAQSHTNACFSSMAKTDAAGFEALNTHMRLAWPGRRINLTKSTPLGLWQFTYILGIAEEGSSIYARFNPDLFHASGSDKVLELIHTSTTLVSAAYLPEAQSAELLMHKNHPLDSHTTFIGTNTTDINWHHPDDLSYDWNAVFYTALNLNVQQNTKTSTTRHSRGNKQQNLRQQLAHELDSQGLPEFPASYIYHISADELDEFTLEHPPWHICQGFMGSYSVCDSLDQPTCEVTGARAHALVLASYLHKKIVLPKSEELCNTIVRHYLEDLRLVYMHILEEAHVHLKTSAAAKRFGNKFWRELPLPPWKKCQEVATYLGVEL
ncbi:MAG: hypothetical protein RBR02_05695 [Desulfuromonadaceae bacterium]|nr:hypothetical protein [Desulfuromonadaceae bacterium]